MEISTSKSLESYKAQVESILKKRYGIAIDDCTGEKILECAFLYSKSPEEFVDWIAGKYDLDRIDVNPFTGAPLVKPGGSR